MNTAFYVAMLAGATWLMVWSALPPELRQRHWSPFAFREEPEPAQAAGAEEPARAAAASSASQGLGGWRTRARQRLAARPGEPGPARRRIGPRRG